MLRLKCRCRGARWVGCQNGVLAQAAGVGLRVTRGERGAKQAAVWLEGDRLADGAARRRSVGRGRRLAWRGGRADGRRAVGLFRGHRARQGVSGQPSRRGGGGGRRFFRRHRKDYVWQDGGRRLGRRGGDGASHVVRLHLRGRARRDVGRRPGRRAHDDGRCAVRLRGGRRARHRSSRRPGRRVHGGVRPAIRLSCGRRVCRAGRIWPGRRGRGDGRRSRRRCCGPGDGRRAVRLRGGRLVLRPRNNRLHRRGRSGGRCNVGLQGVNRATRGGGPPLRLTSRRRAVGWGDRYRRRGRGQHDAGPRLRRRSRGCHQRGGRRCGGRRRQRLLRERCGAAAAGLGVGVGWIFAGNVHGEGVLPGLAARLARRPWPRRVKNGEDGTRLRVGESGAVEVTRGRLYMKSVKMSRGDQRWRCAWDVSVRRRL